MSGVPWTFTTGTAPITVPYMLPVPSTKASRTRKSRPGAMPIRASHTKPAGRAAKCWTALKRRQPSGVGFTAKVPRCSMRARRGTRWPSRSTVPR